MRVSLRLSTLVFSLLLTGTAEAGPAPADGEAAASGSAVHTKALGPYAPVDKYLESVSAMQLIAQFSRSTNAELAQLNGNEIVLFKAAIAAAEGQPKLADAVKNLRKAESAMLTNGTRQDVDIVNRAVADVKVELELIE